MTQKEISSCESAKDLLKKRTPGVNGAEAQMKMQSRTKSDPSAAQYVVGDEIYVSDKVEDLFISSFNGSETSGCICAAKTAAGTSTAKSLYFAALDRGVPVYGSNGQPTGEVISAKDSKKAKHDVYDAVQNAANDEEIWNTIKGRTLKVADVLKVKTARYNRAGQIVGTRERNLPVFDFA